MPPSVHSSNVLLRILSHSEVNTPPPTNTHTHTPNLHSEAVTQHGSLLVMEPVSHPANINLNPHPFGQHEPPPTHPHDPLSDETAPGKQWGSGPVGARGVTGGGGQEAKLEPYFMHNLSG